MNNLLRALDTLPRGVRWALVPVGIVASLIVSSLVDSAFAAAGGPYRTPPTPVHIATAAFIAAATRTLFPAVLSPRPWPVGIVMFALDFLLRAGLPGYRMIAYEYVRLRAANFMGDVVTDVVAGMAGGSLGLYLIRRIANRG